MQYDDDLCLSALLSNSHLQVTGAVLRETCHSTEQEEWAGFA